MEEKWVLHNFNYKFVEEKTTPTNKVKIITRHWHEMIDKPKARCLGMSVSKEKARP